MYKKFVSFYFLVGAIPTHWTQKWGPSPHIGHLASASGARCFFVTFESRKQYHLCEMQHNDFRQRGLLGKQDRMVHNCTVSKQNILNHYKQINPNKISPLTSPDWVRFVRVFPQPIPKKDCFYLIS